MKYQELITNVLAGAFVTKALILGCSWPESLVILTIYATCIIEKHYSENKKIKEFEKKMAQYDADVAALTNKISEVSNNIGKMHLSGLTRLGK